MFGLLRRVGQNSLRFPSYQRSISNLAGSQRFLVAKRLANEPTCRSVSTKEAASASKIQVIAPHLRKVNRRRRPIAAMYKEQENSLPKVKGMAKCESYDLCEIFEDEHLSAFYQITYVDDGKFSNLNELLIVLFRF